MPDAPDVPTFWRNIRNGRYSITDVDPLRWDPHLYYDPDPKAPDKTYSKIGGWVRDWEWNPREWKLPIMPRVADAMDDTQKWALACTHQALTDYGYPGAPARQRPDRRRPRQRHGRRASLRDGAARRLPGDRRGTGAGAELRRAARATSSGPSAPSCMTASAKRYPEITEDTMPGELSNCIAGRVANLFNFRGPNYVVDAACASAMAAIGAAVEGLVDGDYDAVITGGIDRNMGASHVHQVLQDRRPVGHGHPPVRRRRRRLRDGRGRGDVPAEAPGGRRTRRRPHLRGAPRHRRIERRAGQGDHRARTRSARSWRCSGPGARRRVSRRRHRWSKGTAPRPGSATWSSTRAWPRSSAAPGSPRARSLSARSSRTSAISRVRPAPPGCSRR